MPHLAPQALPKNSAQKAVKTRFAPSPTGFIHLGNIRSALYPWAFAKSTGGQFVLRIEDTDEERSSQQAVDVIIESMQWLGLDYDEGPYYQMQRMSRYQAVLETLLEQGWVYPCYMSQAELDALREQQMANKEKPRYDGTWRPEPGKTLPPIPAGVQPVLRFKTPREGSLSWDDKVKGLIEISNSELDDLVLARPAAPGQRVGTPTYNFCVVVDDIDMDITHVIRGDDHVNNTPRQIHIFRALGHPEPIYAHLPTVLGENGEKMSKRSGAKAVTAYRDEGYLPEAMVNYLARLGWSHGDDEIFSVEQFLAWFNLDHLGKSAAQFDEAKLRWVNAQHLKRCDNARLAKMLHAQLARSGIDAGADSARLQAICALYKDRCDTVGQLANWALPHYTTPERNPTDAAKHLSAAIAPAIASLRQALAQSPAWDAPHIAQAIQSTLAQHQLKMPQLAMPVRVLTLGQAQSPSVDACLALIDKDAVLDRLAASF